MLERLEASCSLAFAHEAVLVQVHLAEDHRANARNNPVLQEPLALLLPRVDLGVDLRLPRLSVEVKEKAYQNSTTQDRNRIHYTEDNTKRSPWIS